jgi:hypothetical protein
MNRLFPWIIVLLVVIMLSCSEQKLEKEINCYNKIYEVELKSPLNIEADLNGDGKNEKITFSNAKPYEDDGSLKIDSILNIKIYDENKLLYNYNLPSRKYYEYSAEYYIQKFRYISSVTKDTHRDLIFIYAGCCPPELYILYCQPKQYTEGHKMTEDEKYEVLDTGIRLEEFHG